MKPIEKGEFSPEQVYILRRVWLDRADPAELEHRHGLPPGTIAEWVERLLSPGSGPSARPADAPAATPLSAPPSPPITALTPSSAAPGPTPPISPPASSAPPITPSPEATTAHPRSSAYISTLLAHAFESFPEAVTITDLNDQFVYVNRAFCERYGYTREEILGERPTILVPPGAVAEVFPHVTDATRRGGWKGEVMNRTKKGRLFPIQLTTAPILDEEGRLFGLMGISEDITDRRREQRKLEQTENSLRSGLANLHETQQRHIAVLRSTPHGLCMVGPDWVVQYANPAFARMVSGTESEDLAGMSFRILFPSAESFHAFRTWARQVHAESEWASRTLLLQRAHGKPFRCEVALIRSSPFQTESGYVATLIDLSRRGQDTNVPANSGGG